MYTLLYEVIKMTATNITKKSGNAVILNKNNYTGLIETLYVLSKPELKDKVIEGKNTSISECIPENKVDWSNIDETLKSLL